MHPCEVPSHVEQCITCVCLCIWDVWRILVAGGECVLHSWSVAWFPVSLMKSSRQAHGMAIFATVPVVSGEWIEGIRKSWPKNWGEVVPFSHSMGHKEMSLIRKPNMCVFSYSMIRWAPISLHPTLNSNEWRENGRSSEAFLFLQEKIFNS